MKTHSGEKSNKCNQCDFASSDASNLRKHLKRIVEKSQTNATIATMPPLMQAILGSIWKRIVEKSQTNATSVSMHLFKQALWKDIWKHTVGKSHKKATSVTLHCLMDTLWVYFWNRTVEKSLTDAISAIMHPLRHVIYGDTWKHTLEKSCISVINVTIHIWRYIWNHTAEKANKCNWCDFATSWTTSLKMHMKKKYLFWNYFYSLRLHMFNLRWVRPSSTFLELNFDHFLFFSSPSSISRTGEKFGQRYINILYYLRVLNLS